MKLRSFSHCAGFALLSLNLFAPSRTNAQQLVAQTIAPGKMSAVSINTLPNATCTLRAQDDSGVVRSLTLYSDDQGQVRFHAQANAESDNPARLELQCQAGNQVMKHSIELRWNAAIAAANPAAPAPASHSGLMRPALAGDPMLPSQEELISRGYPLRPDPAHAPGAYSTWLRMVTTETMVIQAKAVTQPGRVHIAAAPAPNGPGTPPTNGPLPTSGVSTNWSGLVLYQDARLPSVNLLKPYDFVSGEWIVPAVTGEKNIQDDSFFWVGMDGWGSSDVVQDGTEQQVTNVSYFGFNYTIAAYYAWGEFYPLFEQRITNFPVNPGDQIVGQVWMGNPGGGPNINGSVGICFLQNVTRGISTTLDIAPPSGTKFSGITAEWIMERPTFNGSLTDLSNYGAANMHNAFAQRSDGTVVDSSGNSNSLNLVMVNNNFTWLSKVISISDTSMIFEWLGFK